jgi:hypothetical protein
VLLAAGGYPAITGDHDFLTQLSVPILTDPANKSIRYSAVKIRR